MAFLPADGDWKFEHIPKKASTLYTVGALITNDGTDNIVATTTGLRQVGICMQAFTTADATTNTIMVAIPRSSDALMYGDIGTGTPAVADRNKTCDIASGGLTVAYGTDSHHQLVIAGYISATRGLFKINSKVSTLPGA